MITPLCPTGRAAAPWRSPWSLRELRANPLVKPLDLAALGSVSTLAVALVSALALAVLGGV